VVVAAKLEEESTQPKKKEKGLFENKNRKLQRMISEFDLRILISAHRSLSHLYLFVLFPVRKRHADMEQRPSIFGTFLPPSLHSTLLTLWLVDCVF
jgi:hypothetical protein